MYRTVTCRCLARRGSAEAEERLNDTEKRLDATQKVLEIYKLVSKMQRKACSES